MTKPTQIQLQQFRLIGDLTDQINRGVTFAEVFQGLFANLPSLIPCNRLAVGFLQPDGHTLVLGPVLSDGAISLATGYAESIEGSSLKALIERGETRTINDLEAHLARRPESRSTRLIVNEGLRASLTAPLLAADRRIGVIWFSSRAAGSYSPAHESFARMIAGHLAIVVEKDRLVNRLEADNRQLAEANELKTRFVERLKEEVDRQTAAVQRAQQKQQVLLEIAKAIHRTLDLGAVFRTLVAALRPILSFERASILLLSEAERVLRFRELEPPERELLGRETVIPVEGSAAGQAIREARPVYTADLGAGSSYFEDDLLRRAGIRSRVALPLFVQRHPIGTFNLASNTPHGYSADDLEFLTELADQLSVAVANSEAYLQIAELKNRFQDETIRLREAITRAPSLSELIGESRAWRKILTQIERVAATDATVLVRGETGTGKELIARAIHRLSPRRGRPFIAINCGALSPELIASELFGHEKGAFTGAVQRKLGRLELANHGVLFLDEVAELPADMQVKLLRVLQEREFERVGGTQTIKVDVRLIAATNRDLEAARADGRLRDDLYFRLNVFPILVPPLRERKEDIEPLLHAFLRRHAQRLNKRFESIDRRTLERCLLYHWPGNVRELENLVERSVILGKEPVFSMDPLLEAEALAGGPAPVATLDEAIRAHLTQVLKTTRGKIYGPGGAAGILGVKPSTLQAKLKKYGLDRRSIGGI